MERKPGECRAPTRIGTTVAGCAQRVLGSAILHEIANSLSGDPTIAGYALRSLREPFEQGATRCLCLGWLGRRRELAIIPPVAEPADSHVAASRAPAILDREIRAPRALEGSLRRSRVADHALRVRWRRYARGLKLGRAQRRSGLKRQRDKQWEGGGENS
jgi:hypothetical protein